MAAAAVVYHRNEHAHRGLAPAGALFGLKTILLIPHLLIIGILEDLACLVGYVGFWLVAITGKIPDGLQSLITMWLRWGARAYGWLAGVTDRYPPFDPEPRDYPIDARLPVNTSPRKGWAVAGIFLIPKAICILPHLILLFFTMVGVVFATWWGYLVAAFTGRLPAGIQDFVAGTMQWYTRVMAWFLGLTDEFPAYGTAITPA